MIPVYKYKSNLFKNISLENYEVQTRFFLIQVIYLLLILSACVFMFFLNRITYSQKHIESTILHSNLSNNQISRVEPIAQIKGDTLLIENYLKQYIFFREEYTSLNRQGIKTHIKAFSDHETYAQYNEFMDALLQDKTETFLRKVNIDLDKTKMMDQSSYRFDFTVLEKPSVKSRQEFISKRSVFIRYRPMTDDEIESNSDIKDFDLINPLNLVVTIYNVSTNIDYKF